jgi:hypothetical protein
MALAASQRVSQIRLGCEEFGADSNLVAIKLLAF